MMYTEMFRDFFEEILLKLFLVNSIQFPKQNWYNKVKVLTCFLNSENVDILSVLKI